MPTQAAIRIGIIGAGYIATWHADAIRATPGLSLAAVCDPAEDAAKGLAHAYGVPAFTNLDMMIAAGVCDAVHILTPPNLHRDLAGKCLKAGLHVFIEKPVALSAQEVETIIAAANAAGCSFGVSHNFLGLPAYERLKRLNEAGELGLVSSAQINWSLPLAPLRSGPYGIWLMRDTRNLLLELGPHPFSFAADLFGPLDIEHVNLGQWITLPGGGRRPQSWRILAKASNVDVTISLSLVETYDDRSVTLRGSSAMARLDYAADTLIVSGDNTADLVANAFLKEIGKAGSHLREAFVNGFRQTNSLNQKSPYGLSFRNTILAFYRGLRTGVPDERFSPGSALRVMQAIDASLEKIPAPHVPAPVPMHKPQPSVMVIGGTGFIGRNLTRSLVKKSIDVRVLSRGGLGPFADIAAHVETVSVSLGDENGLVRAMEGIDCVFNLAKSMDKTWDAALENDVGSAMRVARACRKAGVRRLIYTGTIASYDMSKPDRPINEDIPFGDLSSRNLYARSKAECERRLMEMLHTDGPPLAIARPGIVVGDGGPLQHWGIGRWHGPGAVKLWGDGSNILPFVLADDVSNGLIAMMERPEAIGESFNLTGDPMFTGRDYFEAIHRRAGAKLKVRGSNLTALWLADSGKYLLKRYGLRRKGTPRRSLADWKSRGHLSPFDNEKPKRLLGWQPETDRDAFLRRAIDEAHLFW
jgi:predicted dehydrogenase/nucleoside-diphosphate-sugar epimerase